MKKHVRYVVRKNPFKKVDNVLLTCQSTLITSGSLLMNVFIDKENNYVLNLNSLIQSMSIRFYH